MLLSPAEVETLDRAAHSNDKLVLDLLQIIARIKVVYRIDDIRGQPEQAPLRCTPGGSNT